MNHASTTQIPTEEDRQALYRALARWTGNPTVAEDLVQQTMIEAWQSDTQPPPSEWRRWLFGVARNVLMRWRRDPARDLRRSIAEPQSAAVLAAASSDSDIDCELEHKEIVSLVHSIMDDLPSETRQVLLMKYIHELPEAEIAGELGLHEKALEGRLHRGKQKLRQHLLAYKPDTAISLGILHESRAWQPTDIWCTTCGMQTLEARWSDSGSLRMDCPACANGWFRDGQRSHQFGAKVHNDYVGIRPSFRKAMSAIHSLNDVAMAAGRDGSWDCPSCTGTVRPHAVDSDLQDNGLLDLCYACDTCRSEFTWRFLPASGIYTSAGKQFEKRNERVRMLKPIEEERHGRLAIRSAWEAIDGAARLMTWYDLETWRLLDTVTTDDDRS